MKIKTCYHLRDFLTDKKDYILSSKSFINKPFRYKSKIIGTIIKTGDSIDEECIHVVVKVDKDKQKLVKDKLKNDNSIKIL